MSFARSLSDFGLELQFSYHEAEKNAYFAFLSPFLRAFIALRAPLSSLQADLSCHQYLQPF